ncbi:hypothetical protein HPP92_013326 [Vanilla planifolia]|uniref:Spatacsin C-terminal domain-containing protein n=1 Tax=Vanilla planifolia TaxID=51239 RepID=A0A835UXW5_VANPL|nr:hypothetical protein HPP92_013326 [Vanilla planifolia]
MDLAVARRLGKRPKFLSSSSSVSHLFRYSSVGTLRRFAALLPLGEPAILMSSFAGSHGSPVMLKLAKWDHLPLHLTPSELSEVSLSPARKLLLLHSFQSEAFLFPLTAECLLYSSIPVEKLAESVQTSNGASCAVFDSCALISNVKSFAWGHFLDSYDHFEHSDFTEVLTVCNDYDIVFHVFHSTYTDLDITKYAHDSAHLHHNWVEWGPSFSVHEKEQIQFVHGSQNQFVDARCPKNSLEQKNWLRTFLYELDASWSGSRFLAKFPTKLSYLHHAVLSFEMSCNTSKFLESYDNIRSCDESKQVAGDLKSSLDNTQLLDDNSDPISKEGVPVTSTYKCSRVFSGSIGNLIGLVLFTSSEHSPIVSCEEELRGKAIVVIIMLHKWGMEWVCAIDIGKPFRGLGPSHSSKWADFQFLNSYLLCLDTSGLTCIWCAKTGNPIACFDVVGCCKVNSKILPPLCQFNLPEQDSARNESIKAFTRLMVVPYSFLLAIADEHGVIYVVDANDHISGYLDVPNKTISLSQNSELGMLASWTVAGEGIGCQKVLSDISNSSFLYPLDTSKGDLTSDNHKKSVQRISKHIHDNVSNFNCCRSSSYTHSQGMTSKPSEALSAPMRRVFFPPQYHGNGGSICFSAFGVTRLVSYYGEKGEVLNKIFHTNLYFSRAVDGRHLDDCFLYRSHSVIDCYVGECIGFSFKGLLYVVTQEGLFVVLPSFSYSCNALSVESERSSTAECEKYELSGLLTINEPEGFWKPWQIEIFDRTLSFEGPEEAENICLLNGWDLRIARLRRMQYGLHYLKYDYIKESLDMLVDVNLAEEGILHLLFTTVYLLFCKVGSDNEVSLASRLLVLAACFATKMIRKYGLALHKKDHFFSVHKDFRRAYSQELQHSGKLGWIDIPQRLSEMSLFLEVIRNFQSKLSSKDKRLLLDADGKNLTDMVDSEILLDESVLPNSETHTVLPGIVDFVQSQDRAPLLSFDKVEDLSISLEESSFGPENFNMICVPESGPSARKKLLSLENPKDTIKRWKMDSLDLKTVVKDALNSGRLPLAVLQLHLQHHEAQKDDKEHYDTFNEVREAGKAIAYELFMKGEGTLALETLLRLGEDIEDILRQLFLGTVRRSLRTQIAEAMKSYRYLRKQECKILQEISLIERLYPSSNFWSTFHGKQKDRTLSTFSLEASEIEFKFHVNQNVVIECGDVDGTILTSWVSEDNGPDSVVDEANTHTGYWVCAAAWADAWDQQTIDRVVLDQSINMGVVSWESQLGYHLSHSNLEEVQKLLDMIPPYLLFEETLKVNLDHSSSNVRINFPDDSIYICAAEEVEPFCLFIPNVKVFRFSIVNLCSSWLKEVVEMELARKQIFLKDYWESTAELMPLFSHSGLIFNPSKGFINSDLPANFLDLDNLEVCKYVLNDTADALHKLIMHYCTQYNFPHFLDLYLDNLNLVYDDNIFRSLHEAAGNCEWAKWLLLLRVKGCEYDSSFYNARSNLSKQVALASNLSVHDINEIIHTVDDIAEGCGEMAALATLMYAAESMQKCICIGSISRHCSSSSQCTLENLRPGLEKFPTLWRTLVSACFEIDFFGRSKSSNSAFEKSGFSDYLRWRDTLFSSAGGDTSLVQMLPCWFPKSIQRLIRQFVQVPLGWQSLSSAMSSGASIVFQGKNYALGADINGVNSVTWEAAIQKNIEKELYASFEVGGSFLEQYLHRCRALGAFNHLLSLRASKLKISTEHGEPSRQNTIQSDVQAMLSPLSQNEWSLIPSVIQMAILHFDDSALVASCTFLLELCGLSASMLRTDIAALLRISDFYNKQNTFFNVSPKGSAIHSQPFRGDITYSLARALADNFTHHDDFMELKQKDVPSKISKGKQPLQPLMIVLQHLEKASLPSLEEGKTCGFWLSSDIGDGLELRSQQKDASLHWKLVMEFCRIHHLPLSTKYLALLANDNDWVGFLMEAQIGMFPIDAVIEVAAKEFSNSRLKIHILTVLRSMQSMRKKLCSSLGKSSVSDDTVLSNDRFTMVPVELFGLIALCERQKNPGETLLVKAKDLRWSLLAMVASCFSDVSPLSCLIVWLEITAARETSSIKVNDISSKVAENVKAAVEATNELPSGCRTLSFHYNRRNTKEGDF